MLLVRQISGLPKNAMEKREALFGINAAQMIGTKYLKI